MRITNKIIENNSMSNIYKNKALEDKLNTQMASGKKIARPSDDPVIAIRALRLRSTLAEVTQYRDKNVEDADSWLKTTEDAVNSIAGVLEDMLEQCNTGSNKKLTTQNRQAILENLKALRDEVYASGDADYAGRGLFTGYRTGTKLRFQEDTTQEYSITEEFDKTALDDITYIKMDNGTTTLGEINAGNYTDADYAIADTAVSQQKVHRLRLSYDKLEAGNVPVITYYNGAGSTPQNIPVTVVSKYAAGTDPYLQAQELEKGDTKAHAVFIPETGELILSDKAYQALSTTRDYKTTDIDESKFSVTYTKKNWENGDLRPEHYFKCVENPAGKAVKHNFDKTSGNQVISYDVGFNQELRVNTLASECYTHDVGRDVDDMIAVLEQVDDVETVVSTLEKVIADTNTSDADRAIAEKSLAAANKALTFLTEKMQTAFENGITKMQGYLDKTTLAITNIGTRSSKLELVKTRLTSQKTNFKDLVADNEQADTAEVATNLKSAQLAYDAALMSTAKVTQNSLMNFI